MKKRTWEIINGQVLPSVWYPYGTFQRIGFAVFKEIAGSNMDTVRAFGRNMAKGVLQVYKSIAMQGDPAASLERLANLRRTFMDAGESRIKEKGPGWVKMEIIDPPGERGSEVAPA